MRGRPPITENTSPPDRPVEASLQTPTRQAWIESGSRSHSRRNPSSLPRGTLRKGIADEDPVEHHPGLGGVQTGPLGHGVHDLPPAVGRVQLPGRLPVAGEAMLAMQASSLLEARGCRPRARRPSLLERRDDFPWRRPVATCRKHQSKGCEDPHPSVPARRSRRSSSCPAKRSLPDSGNDSQGDVMAHGSQKIHSILRVSHPTPPILPAFHPMILEPTKECGPKISCRSIRPSLY